MEEITTRHPDKLAQLRGEAAYGSIDINSRDNGYFGPDKTAIGGIRATQGATEGTTGIDASGTTGMEASTGINGGYGKGIRPSDSEGEYTTSGYGGGHGTLATGVIDDGEQENERWQASQPRIIHFPPEDKDKDGTTFKFKRFFKNQDRDKEPEKVKLFTTKEIEEKKERLAFVYLHGSGLLDDILEICVKGHEPVTIWQMDEGEALMFAELHLEKAKHSEQDARVARFLLSLYDRWFTLAYAGPRIVRTGRHVKEHGGLGFK